MPVGKILKPIVKVAPEVITSSKVIKKIYTSIKKAPGYSRYFIKAKNGLTKVNINNKQLLSELNKIGSGLKKDGVDFVEIRLQKY